jgi:L-lactate utilization protein LutB
MDLTRSEERIRALVAEAIVTTNPKELESMMNELREALREYIRQTKMLAVSSWGSISPRDER